MAFVLELQITSQQKYIRNFIVNILRRYNINADVAYENDTLQFVCDDTNDILQNAIKEIADTLPASLFLKSSNALSNDKEVEGLPEIDNRFPLSLGLCPSCQKEMFDVSSKRYYYPFTSCNCCGANHSFLTKYPYNRLNSSFKFLLPCEICKEEQNSYGKHEQHYINSCHSCGVPVRLVSKSSERYANDAGSFRTMFEVAAKALCDDKKILIKTTMGYRIFYNRKKLNNNSILMMINSNTITDNLSLITEEYQALLSIERPVMYVALKNESLKQHLDANTAFVKYPDDGFCILLGAELQKLGYEYIAYEAVDSDCDADMLMDYDLEIKPQSDMRFFLNKDTEFIASGERVSFPSHSLEPKDVVSVAENLVGVPESEYMLFDDMEYFDEVKVSNANVLEGDSMQYHTNQKFFLADEASFLSVIVEHRLLGVKTVGAYFDEVPSFLYYDGKNVLRVVPAKEFDANNLLEKISSLRDGSDRLIENLEKTLPQTYEKLENLQTDKSVKLFEAVAIILGLDDLSMRGVSKEAMKFVGKGGIQIDTHVKDNRFDNTAFLASIISYMVAGVSTSILAYSIFESFGDYFNEILQELKAKTKAQEIVLCGTHFANQSLFSRMQRNLKMTPPYMSKNYPIGKENCVVGGVYI